MAQPPLQTGEGSLAPETHAQEGPSEAVRLGKQPEANGPRTAAPARSRSKQAHPARLRGLEAFAQRRQQMADEARDEATALIEQAGETEAVRQALDALLADVALPWREDRARIEAAIEGRDIAAVRRRANGALWAAARDAARTSKRAMRDPQAAREVCTALAVLERLPRTAVRSGQRLAIRPRVHPSVVGGQAATGQ